MGEVMALIRWGWANDHLAVAIPLLVVVFVALVTVGGGAVL